MAGKAVSYQFLDALAKSVGMDAETVKQALAEINQLQQQTQALEVAVQGKAPTNHASQQPIFGTANEQMYGHVKITHEVTNDSTDGVAVSPDAVYAYAPNKNTTPLGVVTRLNVDLVVGGESTSRDAFAQINGNALDVCWGNATYNKLASISVDIPSVYKYEAISAYVALTNAGRKIRVSYNPQNQQLLIEDAGEGFNAYDSALIFLSPNNA